MSSFDKQSHTLIIARYHEDISWIKNVPESFRIVVYNKGKNLPFFQKIRCLKSDRISVFGLKNTGREAETYLHYLKETPDFGDPEKYTVFCQGNPFDHSPDFLELLNHVPQWKPVQPLSCRWRKDRQVPPASVVNMDDRFFINNLRIRVEYFSAYTLAPIHFHDPGIVKIVEDYRSVNQLKAGTHLSQHFLSKCNLPDIAAHAASHPLGRFSFGAIFAVANSLLQSLPPGSVCSMHKLAQEHYSNGYLFERHWQHIFGIPFLLSDCTLNP